MSNTPLSPNAPHLNALSNRVKDALVPLTAGQEWDTSELWILGRRIQDTLDAINGGTLQMTESESKIHKFIDEHAC